MLGLSIEAAASGQPILAIVADKKIINYVPTSTYNYISSTATAQPYTPKELILNPIDQRAFSYCKFKIFAQSLIKIKIGDIILWNVDYYKVIAISNWEKSGFITYDCIQDFYFSPQTDEAITDITGVALCDIIKDWFTQQDYVLREDQILLYNSNYTITLPKTFSIVVQLVSIEPFGFGKVVNVPLNTIQTTEQIWQKCSLKYNIEIFSADGSASKAIATTLLAMNSDYSSIKQKEANITIAKIAQNAQNSTSQVGGTTMTRYSISINCVAFISQTSKQLSTYDAIDAKTIFQFV